jgi:N-acetylneuraminate synthase
MIAAIRELEPLDPGARLQAVTSRFGDVSAIVGDGVKRIVAAEAPLYPNDKRSIHAIRDIAAGDTIGSDNVRVLRSERNLAPGLHPRYWEVACGAVAAEPVSAGDGLQWRHLIRRAGAVSPPPASPR